MRVIYLHVAKKFGEFARQPVVFRSVVAAQAIITREMTRLCLQENQRRHIEEVTLCCKNIKEPGHYACENYPNYRPKRKRTLKKRTTKPLSLIHI